MSVMLSKTYTAFNKLNLLITLGASTLVGVGLILLRLFVFD